METYTTIVAEKLNGATTNQLSEIQTADADEAFIQELEQEHSSPILHDEPDDDLNECREDTAEAEIDGDDYFFPSPDDLEKVRPPEVGMAFATLEDAQCFVNILGQITGFVVIKGKNYKRRNITLTCNKSREMKENETRQGKRKRNCIERTGCCMQVTVKLVIAGRWEIMAVQNEHNHPLLSSHSLIGFFLSHKYMSEEERNLSKILQESRIKPAKIMEIFKTLRGSFKNTPVSKMAVNNLEQSDWLMKTWNTDIGSTLEHVRRFQKELPGFYYAIKTDGNNTIKSIFWTDARARLDFASYGDFISFDVAYSTSENNMLLALFIRMNWHGKTTVFGWALLEDEKAETFSWLFRIFLDVMDDKKPSTILTHQDSAIEKSIAEVFPTVFHRFDMWHMMRKATDELRGFMAHRPGMEAELTCLVTDS